MATDVLLAWLSFGASLAAIVVSIATLAVLYAARRRMQRNQLEDSHGND